MFQIPKSTSPLGIGAVSNHAALEIERLQRELSRLRGLAVYQDVLESIVALDRHFMDDSEELGPTALCAHWSTIKSKLNELGVQVSG